MIAILCLIVFLVLSQLTIPRLRARLPDREQNINDIIAVCCGLLLGYSVTSMLFMWFQAGLGRFGSGVSGLPFTLPGAVVGAVALYIWSKLGFTPRLKLIALSVGPFLGLVIEMPFDSEPGDSAYELYLGMWELAMAGIGWLSATIIEWIGRSFSRDEYE